MEPKAKIGDYVWLDTDNDGLQDFHYIDENLDENGINGVTVNLYESASPNTIYLTDITHTHADSLGFYEFEVCRGDYFVESADVVLDLIDQIKRFIGEVNLDSGSYHMECGRMRLLFEKSASTTTASAFDISIKNISSTKTNLFI